MFHRKEPNSANQFLKPWICQLPLFLLLLCGVHSLMGQQKEVYRIGILVEEQTTETDSLFVKLTEEISAVVGEDAEILFPPESILANDNSRKKAEENLALLNQNDTDILLAFGPINSVVVSEQKVFPKPTILFGAVPEDFIGIDQKRETSGIPNFVYLITSHSIKEDLTAFRDLCPYKNVGIAINKAIADNLEVEKFLDGMFTDTSVTYRLISFEKSTDILQELGNIDALYLGGGHLFSDESIKLLVEELNLARIPSFTATTQRDVELGILATMQSSATLDQIFRRIALSVEAIIAGTDPADLPLYFEPREELTINFNTAEALDIPIRYSQISTTNLVGDPDNLISEKKYDLKMVMEEVLLRNLTLQASQKNIDLSGQDLKLAKSNYLPNLEAGVTATNVDPALAEVSNGQNPQYSTAGNLTLSQVLYSPGANANIRINKELLEAAKANLDTDKLDALANISEVYFNALLLKANLQISKSNMDLTEENLTLAQQKYESGQSGKPDLLRFQSQLAQNTQQFVEAYNQLQQIYFVLNQLLNQPINRRIDVLDAKLDDGIYSQYNYERIKEILDDPHLLEPFMGFLMQEAKKNSPELRSLNYNLRANNHNLWLNDKGRFLPTLGLQGQVNSTWSRSGKGTEFPPGFGSIPLSYYTLGINLSLPIFQQNQRNINRESAIVQREQLLINQENLQLNLDQQISSGVLQVVNQIANLELAKVFESTAKESLELTQEAYRSGSVTWVQLIDAQSNYFQAQLSNATAVYNFLNSAIALERSIGSYFILKSDEENEAFRDRFAQYLLERQ